ncbi:hypothetical protein LCGC14_2625380, partial [marine sediment metagenome]
MKTVTLIEVALDSEATPADLAGAISDHLHETYN